MVRNVHIKASLLILTN